MKTIMKSLLIAAFLGIALHAGTASANEWLVTPTNVGCFDSGECFILVSPSIPTSDPNTCGSRTQVRWLTSSNPGADAIFKTALSAFLAGKKMIVNVYAGATCVSGFPKVTYAYVTN
jgi:hypothetical protein